MWLDPDERGTPHIYSLCELHVLCERPSFCLARQALCALGINHEGAVVFEPAPQCIRASVVLFSGHTSAVGILFMKRGPQHSLRAGRNPRVAGPSPVWRCRPSCLENLGALACGHAKGCGSHPDPAHDDRRP